MSAPTLIDTYPADADTGIPVGITIKLFFDYGLDPQSVRDSIVLYGADFDMTSGPDTAIWVDKDTGDNPFFLASPGFQGLVPLKYELAYYSLGSVPGEEVNPGVITSQEDEMTALVGQVVKITLDHKYNSQLASDTLYTLVITGDPDEQDTGLSARTVFDIVADPSNSGTGEFFIWGTWSGLAADELNIEITADGNVGTAEYKWWYSSQLESEAVVNNVTNRRFRSLADQLKVRCSGSNFVTGDRFRVNVAPTQRLAESYKIQFTTNDGSYSLAPESPSTPASSTPPLSVLPSATSPFEVVEMIPASGSYNVSNKNRTITILFSEDLDPDTITTNSVKLWKYPVSGVYENTHEPLELQKILSVSGNTLTIKY